MIVCKIMADFDDPSGDFSGLFDSLAQLGAILCPGAMYFASSLDPIDKKKVKKILKKYGYPDSVIIEYGVGNPPKETPSINGWIFDFVTQNAIMRLGKDHRDALREGMHQLDEIDAMIAKELGSFEEIEAVDADIGDDNDTEE